MLNDLMNDMSGDKIPIAQGRNPNFMAKAQATATRLAGAKRVEDSDSEPDLDGVSSYNKSRQQSRNNRSSRETSPSNI